MKIFTALKKGEMLKDPATWKNAQSLVNLGAALIPIAAMMYPPLGAAVESGFADKAIIALGGFNAYLTTATSAKVGL